MHGDFSRWLFDFRSNDHGILHQQGKVLLDQDINALTLLGVRWQVEAARAAFGANVVAVPEEDLDAFRVTAVSTYDHGTRITVDPGRVFCDGALAYLDAPGPVQWRAEPAAPPSPPGTRQAIVLDCWHVGLSGYQDPRLLEPALGGPDTAERAHLAMALRLVTLGPTDHCDAATLDHDTGRLTVALDPPDVIGDPDCPIEDAGGYRGIAHHNYRVEVAATGDGVARFKWSRYNGGLVGRGRFSDDGSGGTPRLELRANQRAIATSGLTRVYVEALAYDEDARGWYVVYGAGGSIANDHEIDLDATPIFGSGIPGDPTDDFFVRIWDGVEVIGSGPQPIGDGINVTFTGGGAYPPDTYWTFAVRAGLTNPATLLDDARRHGPNFLRAPLATFTWGLDGTVDPSTITDCRRPFGPLTRRDGCCTIRVGDGVTSRGDVTSLQAAIDRLPPEGGTICLLPGVHVGGAVLHNRQNVTIHGCGWFSVIVGQPINTPTGSAALRVVGGRNLRIENLSVLAADIGNGILVDRDYTTPMCKGLVIERVFALGAGPSAIDVDDAEDVLIRDCDIAMADRVVPLATGRWPALTLLGIDCRIEHNRIHVAGMMQTQAPTNIPPTNIPPTNIPPVNLPDPVAAPARSAPAPARAISYDAGSYARAPRPATPMPATPAETAETPAPARSTIIARPLTTLTHRAIPMQPAPAAAAPPAQPAPVAAAPPAQPAPVTAAPPAQPADPAATEATAEPAAIDRTHLMAEQPLPYESATLSFTLPGSFTQSRETPLIAHAGLGGLWLRGGCEHVTVLDNRIESGIGHGIILGHIVPAFASPGLPFRLGWIHNFGDPCEPCADATIIVLPGVPGFNSPAIAGPPLDRIVIEGNEILGMGQAGIAVYGYLTDINTGLTSIEINALRIVRNQISGCMYRARAAIPQDSLTLAGYGVIALASVTDLDVLDNRIERNGFTNDAPVCALYACFAASARVTDNVLSGNGRWSATATAAQGARGGIYFESINNGLVVHDNDIDAELGHAIRARGTGPVQVTDNRLTSRTVNNVNELVSLVVNASAPGAPIGPILFNDNHTRLDGRNALDGHHPIRLHAVGGDVSFADNHCYLRASDQAHVSQVYVDGRSARLTSSRLIEEPMGCVQFSAIAVGDYVIATLNQTDHCLAITGTAVIQRDNIEHGAVDPQDCRDAAIAYFGPI